jgi:D-amino-acid dehydrogenase
VTPRNAPRSVAVIGAGVVGLCCAYYLRAAGMRVTVVERDRVGSGASRGNAGEICPDLVQPLPAPGVIGPALRSLHRPDTALHIHPRPSIDLARFLLGFTRHATRKRHTAGATALTSFAAGTFDLFRELESVGVDAVANKKGFLFVFGSASSARGALDGVRALGAPIADSGLLGADELTDREPCLSTGARAGFLVEDQWSIDPNLFVDRLARRLVGLGVDLVEGARVTSVQDCVSGVRVRTANGVIDSDIAVVAAGIWSRDICRTLGVDMNIFPGKGYSFSVPVDHPPNQLIHLGDAHVAVSPLGGGLRVAGTMEFDPDHDRFRHHRVAAIVSAARPYLTGVGWDSLRDEWVGPRPMTPDGLPAIGVLPGCRNVVLASGHNMLGLMLAPATGRLVTDLVAEGHPRPDASAFEPGRIARPRPPAERLGRS